MKQIQKVSSCLLFVFNLLLIALPLSISIQWLLIDTSTIKNLLAQGFLQQPVQTPMGYINLGTVHWSALTKTIGLASDFLGLLPLFVGLFFLKAIFHNYQKGEIFSTGNAVYYKYLGWLFFLDALLAKPLSETLMVLAISFSNSPGHRYISIGIGSPNLEAVFCGVLVIVISWIMLEASKLFDEQKFTI